MRKYYGDGGARPRCRWATAEPGRGARGRRQELAARRGPGRGAGGRRQGQGGPRDRHFRAAGSRVAISRAGRRPPAHTAARPTGQDARRPEIRRCHKQRKNP